MHTEVATEFSDEELCSFGANIMKVGRIFDIAGKYHKHVGYFCEVLSKLSNKRRRWV
jgi:hypothetical protein